MAISHCYWHLAVNNGNFAPFNTIRGQSDLFTVQCCHWHSKADIPPSQQQQRTEWSLYCSMLSLRLIGRYTPSFNTIRGQSDLFTVQCCHWHSKADIPLPTFNTIRGQSDLFTVQCCQWHSKADIPLPTFNTIRGQSDLFTVQCCHWHSKADITPPSPHLVNTSRGQSDLFTVQCCHWHSKADITPLSPHLVNTSRGQSDLFAVQCCHWHSKADIPPHSTLSRTEWSLHCSMLSLTLKGRYTSPPIQH